MLGNEQFRSTEGYLAFLIGIETEDIKTLYNAFKEATNNTRKKVAKFKRRRKVEGLPPSVEKAYEQRRQARTNMFAHPEN